MGLHAKVLYWMIHLKESIILYAECYYGHITRRVVIESNKIIDVVPTSAVRMNKIYIGTWFLGPSEKRSSGC